MGDKVSREGWEARSWTARILVLLTLSMAQKPSGLEGVKGAPQWHSVVISVQSFAPGKGMVQLQLLLYDLQALLVGVDPGMYFLAPLWLDHVTHFGQWKERTRTQSSLRHKLSKQCCAATWPLVLFPAP